MSFWWGNVWCLKHTHTVGMSYHWSAWCENGPKLLWNTWMAGCIMSGCSCDVSRTPAKRDPSTTPGLLKVVTGCVAVARGAATLDAGRGAALPDGPLGCCGAGTCAARLMSGGSPANDLGPTPLWGWGRGIGWETSSPMGRRQLRARARRAAPPWTVRGL